MSPSEEEDDMPLYGTRTTQMSCDLCKGGFQILIHDILALLLKNNKLNEFRFFCLKSTTEIKKRKAAGWAKRTIKSVASWWWLNVHDEKCTDGFDIPDWIMKFPVVKMNETYDELKL